MIWLPILLFVPGLTAQQASPVNPLQAFFNLISMQESTLCSGTGAANSKITGACVTSTLCSSANGKVLGSCNRAGWTCCVIPATGSSKSSSSPTVVTSRAVLLQSSDNALSIFEFPKQPGMCQLTLQFLDTKLQPPTSTVLDSGNCVADAITITGSPTLYSGFITVCGDMSGQHMHLSYRGGALGDHNSDKITVLVRTTSTSAKYAINAVQIACDDPDKVSSFCLQQFIAETGQIRSFGYPRQLNHQYYHICTRGVEVGARTVTWKECSNSLGGSAPKFFLTGNTESDGSLPQPLYGDTLCTSDYIYNTLLNPPGRHCGGSFPKITVDNGLGHLSVNFDGNEVGHSAVVRDLPPSVTSCSDIFFPGHMCRHPVIGDNRDSTCICTLNPDFPIQLIMPLLPNEICPTVKGYVCSKMNNVLNRCGCVQGYDEADQGNTGFCLQFTHNY